MAFFPALLFAAIAPLWFRVGTPSGNEPAFLHFFVRHRSRPYYTHANVGKDGLRVGVVPRGGAKARLQPGTYTPWLDFREIMQDGDRRGPSERFVATMIRSWDEPLSNSAFTVEFSLDGTNLYKRLLRKGPGNGMLFAVQWTKEGAWKIDQDAEAAARTRREVEALPPVEGRAPRRFPVTTTLSSSLDECVSMPSVVNDELTALRLIGINGGGGGQAGLSFCRLSSFSLGKLPHADPAEVRQYATRWAERTARRPLRSRPILVDTADELYVAHTHVTNCAICAAKVPGGPTIDKRDGERYYRTVRMLIDSTTEGLRVRTRALGEVKPGLPVAVNNGIWLVFSGNMAEAGLDWFKIYGTGALTYGWGEDWANYGRTKQINSIYWDAMRAACLDGNVPFGFYNILAHNEWEIEAKTFAAVGRGARTIHYFSWGPWYSTASDSKSHRPEVARAMRRANFAIGSAENEILAAHCAKGDAAILIGMTGDIWKVKEDNEFGMERSAISLLLRHCGMRTDVLGEEMVARHLGEYPMLFVLDRNVRRDVAKAILDWTRKGGRLYLGPNAMSADEANEPLDIGFPRAEYAKVENVGRPKFELVKRKELDRYEGMRVIVGSSKPYFEERNEGKGRVLSAGFFPGLDYWGTAVANTNRFDMLEYASAHRDFMKKRVIAGIPLRCETSDPRVEVSLLEGKDADVLVFANWTGAPTDVRYTVRTPEGEVRRRGIRRMGAGAFEVLKK